MKLHCWKCGALLPEMRFPYSRYEECSTCKADLHVCRLCREYDPAIANACREERAEFVLDKEKPIFATITGPGPVPINRRTTARHGRPGPGWPNCSASRRRMPAVPEMSKPEHPKRKRNAHYGNCGACLARIDPTTCSARRLSERAG